MRTLVIIEWALPEAPVSILNDIRGRPVHMRDSKAPLVRGTSSSSFFFFFVCVYANCLLLEKVMWWNTPSTTLHHSPYAVPRPRPTDITSTCACLSFCFPGILSALRRLGNSYSCGDGSSCMPPPPLLRLNTYGSCLPLSFLRGVDG